MRRADRRRCSAWRLTWLFRATTSSRATAACAPGSARRRATLAKDSAVAGEREALDHRVALHATPITSTPTCSTSRSRETLDLSRPTKSSSCRQPEKADSSDPARRRRCQCRGMYGCSHAGAGCNRRFAMHIPTGRLCCKARIAPSSAQRQRTMPGHNSASRRANPKSSRSLLSPGDAQAIITATCC